MMQLKSILRQNLRFNEQKCIFEQSRKVQTKNIIIIVFQKHFVYLFRAAIYEHIFVLKTCCFITSVKCLLHRLQWVKDEREIISLRRKVEKYEKQDESKFFLLHSTYFMETLNGAGTGNMVEKKRWKNTEKHQKHQQHI
jgi:hypothetical protein